MVFPVTCLVVCLQAVLAPRLVAESVIAAVHAIKGPIKASLKLLLDNVRGSGTHKFLGYSATDAALCRHTSRCRDQRRCQKGNHEASPRSSDSRPALAGSWPCATARRTAWPSIEWLGGRRETRARTIPSLRDSGPEDGGQQPQVCQGLLHGEHFTLRTKEKDARKRPAFVHIPP